MENDLMDQIRNPLQPKLHCQTVSKITPEAVVVKKRWQQDYLKKRRVCGSKGQHRKSKGVRKKSNDTERK